MISEETHIAIHDSLILEYRNFWSIEQSEALVNDFQDQTNDQDFLEAIRRHRHDRTEGSKGAPIGQYPPTAANIETQLVAINVERMKAKQQDRSKESDQTYRAAVLGDHPSRDQRSKEWGRKIRAEIVKAQEIRKALESHYHLDYLEQRDQAFLMRVLSAAKHEGWEDTPDLLLPVDRALLAAEMVTR